jgi:cell division protein FtsB
MPLMDIQKRVRHLWRTYGTLNNIVMAVALAIAASWAWGTIAQMQTNFAAQKAVDDQQRELQLTELQVATLQYQQNYYKSDEYKDLAAREKLGLVAPGEKVLLLPPNSPAVTAADEAEEAHATQRAGAKTTESNVTQWLKFLTGQSAKSLL